MGRHSVPGPGDSPGDDPYGEDPHAGADRPYAADPYRPDDFVEGDYDDDEYADDSYGDDPYADDYDDDDHGLPAEDYPPTGEQPLYEPRPRSTPTPGDYYPPRTPEQSPYEREPQRFRAADSHYAASNYGEQPYQPYPERETRSRPQEPTRETTGRIRSGAGDPPPRPPRDRPTNRVSGNTGAHDFSDIDFQGGHRRKDSRRGVSLSVVVALVAVVVVVASVILWRFFGAALSDRTDAAAAACADNTQSVAVVVDPSLTAPVRAMAEQYNETANPLGEGCVNVNVSAADSDDVVNGFVGEWPAALGDRPALWIPASSVASARLASVAGPDTIADSTSLLTSPVLLAIRPELKPALAAQNWSTLPALQTNPTSLDDLNMPGWGSLRLVLPRTGDSDASYLAAEALAAAGAPAGAPPTDGVAAVNTLVGAEPKLDDDSSTAALDALLAAGDAAASPVHAVAVTEQQLFSRASQLSDAAATLASWQPTGATPVADYPTVLLKGTWVSPEQESAAGQFADYLRNPEQLAEFAKLGFQTEGGSPPASAVVSFAPPADVLAVGDNSMRTTLANALTAPAAAPSVSIMLDLSMTTDEGGQTRLANVVAALNERIGTLAPNAAVGLTTFDGSAGDPVVTTGALSEQVDGQTRSELLTAGLDSLTATSGGAVSFTTLRNVYSEAVTNYAVGQTNSVLIITAGPHTDQSLDGAGLEETIRSTMDPARPVAVNVVNFGDDPDRATWEAVAQLTGGTYQNLAASDSPELAAALTTMMA